MYTKIKPILDRLAAVVLLVLLAPLLAVLCVLVRWRLGTPIFFKQMRPGLHGKPFQLVKFRTMLDALDSQGNVLPDEQRLTKFGKILRSSSLDELPELWNVIRGEMSFVGPRPLLMDYLELYNQHQARRHDVLPGITGWAQVNGRNRLSWQDKFDLDVWYVDNVSIWLDLKIFLLTFRQVLRRNDVSAENHVTTEKFRGNHNG